MEQGTIQTLHAGTSEILSAEEPGTLGMTFHSPTAQVELSDTIKTTTTEEKIVESFWYKVVARVATTQAKVKFYLEYLTRLHGKTKSVRLIDRYKLTEATIDNFAVVAAKEPDTEDLEALEAKERVGTSASPSGRSGQITISSSVMEVPRTRPPLWDEIFSPMHDYRMRTHRNCFANTRRARQQRDEIDRFRKLRAALADPKHWSGDIWNAHMFSSGVPEYAQDLRHPEETWATYQKQLLTDRETYLREQDAIEAFRGLAFNELWMDEPGPEVLSSMEDEVCTKASPSCVTSLMNFTLNMVFKAKFMRKFAVATSEAIRSKLWGCREEEWQDSWASDDVGQGNEESSESEYAGDWTSAGAVANW